jgi:D-serine dehydratase
LTGIKTLRSVMNRTSAGSVSRGFGIPPGRFLCFNKGMSHPLQSIFDLPLDGRTKGFPLDAPAVRLADIGQQGWGLGDLALPVALLRRSVLERNGRWMAEFLHRTGVSICPHGKTTMAPQLFHRQLADGAWGITLATAQEVRIAYEHGVKRILMANELVGGDFIRWLQQTLDRDPGFDFTCLVDSAEGVQRLGSAAQGDRQIAVLVELGIHGGRTGVRSLEEGLAVARAVKASPHLALRGVECYEGILMTKDPAQDVAAITTWLDLLGDLAHRCAAEELFETDEVILTAGGSAYFDLVVRRLARLDLGRVSRVLLRSGCYLSHDAGHYAQLVNLLEERLPEAWRSPTHLTPALEIWGQVISRPEPTLAFLNLGKRDAGHDLGLPKPARWFRKGLHAAPLRAPDSWRLQTLYDQHAKLEIPADAELRFGDLVGCTISHPCTTFDKWKVVFSVDDDYRVVEAIQTFF